MKIHKLIKSGIFTLMAVAMGATHVYADHFALDAQSKMQVVQSDGVFRSVKAVTVQIGMTKKPNDTMKVSYWAPSGASWKKVDLTLRMEQPSIFGGETTYSADLPPPSNIDDRLRPAVHFSVQLVEKSQQRWVAHIQKGFGCGANHSNMELEGEPEFFFGHEASR
jgi:hypothetical protein